MKANSTINLYQVTEIQLSYKAKVKASDRPNITCSEDAYRILLKNWDEETIEFREEFKVLLLNRANKVLGIVNISMGGISGTVADPKIIFSSALKANCSSIILSHNHPSGNLRPSQADLNLTYKMVEAGKFLEIPVLEHLIVTDEHYYSMADEGVIC